jgi:hypothetical protein
LRRIQGVPEELTELGHPVADGLRVDVELRGDAGRVALVLEPRRQRVE